MHTEAFGIVNTVADVIFQNFISRVIKVHGKVVRTVAEGMRGTKMSKTAKMV